MITEPKAETAHWKRAYMINRVIGIACLLAAAGGYVAESLIPSFRGKLAFWFLFTAVACLYAASISHAKHLSQNK